MDIDELLKGAQECSDKRKSTLAMPPETRSRVKAAGARPAATSSSSVNSNFPRRPPGRPRKAVAAIEVAPEDQDEEGEEVGVSKCGILLEIYHWVFRG